MKKLELEGKRFGNLVVLERDNTYKGRTKWLCKCDCGRIESKFGSSLVRGRCTNCGFHREKDWSGKRFGKLIVIKRAENKGKDTGWLCKCDCGNEKVIRAGDLRSGATQSCGCVMRTNAIKHNMSRTRIYKVWQSMKSRVYYEKGKRYKQYGGRGIKVCDEWLDKENGFVNFYNWAMANGYDENAKHGECTLDRINVNGNYEPSNCRFITNSEQQYNRTNNHYLTYKGKTLCLTQWAKILKVDSTTFCHFINDKNKTVEDFVLEKGIDYERNSTS